MQAPVIFLVGKPQHGKTTSRRIVEAITKLRGASCSDVVYHFLAMRRGTTPEQLRLLPKEELRPVLCEAGDYLCGIDPQGPIMLGSEFATRHEVDSQVYRVPSALIRVLFHTGFRVIDGVRRRLELQHAKEALEWCGVQTLTIHVERPGQAEIKDNTEDLKDFADASVLNDSTIQALEEKLKAILDKHFQESGTNPVSGA